MKDSIKVTLDNPGASATTFSGRAWIMCAHCALSGRSAKSGRGIVSTDTSQQNELEHRVQVQLRHLGDLILRPERRRRDRPTRRAQGAPKLWIIPVLQRERVEGFEGLILRRLGKRHGCGERGGRPRIRLHERSHRAEDIAPILLQVLPIDLRYEAVVTRLEEGKG